MTDPAFDPKHPETWPMLLSVEQVAAIYGRSVESILGSLKPRSRTVRLVPKPKFRHPSQWLRADVMRDLRAHDAMVSA